MGGIAIYALWAFIAYWVYDIAKYIYTEHKREKRITRLHYEGENNIKNKNLHKGYLAGSYNRRSICGMVDDSENKSFGQHN